MSIGLGNTLVLLARCGVPRVVSTLTCTVCPIADQIEVSVGTEEEWARQET